ncbi:hypothetical protein BXY66_1201 [Shimia isoporae]|uniref:Uncharacterized protein n=1 Tax=Shimia isoporae TaxID=647720 RepID=A0A4R1NLC2_9RHOB|nr:hypothetical protein [Shimia isoporae]TCL09156.1 hypothetical protein BXY66_1201 [Shimia isoporae]
MEQIELAKGKHDEWSSQIRYMNEAAVGFAEATVKALLLLNGGAAVAMLAFVANLGAANDSAIDLPSVVRSLVWYAGGAGFAVLTAGFCYVVMYLQATHAQSHEFKYAHPFVVEGPKTVGRRKLVNFFHVAALVIAVVSLASFIVGIWQVSSVIL